VPSLSILTVAMRRVTLPLALALLSSAALPAARPEEPPSDSVGVIEGEAIVLSGPMSVEVVHGQTKTILRSGSDVRVKSGTARIDLVEGGQIAICGPAHFSVLKSAGSLTLALDTGTIQVHIEREPALMVYTAQIQAQTVSIGEGPQDAVFGFDIAGSMCIRANRGAVRLEQQLTGQRVLVPQAGDVLLMNGQLDGLRNNPGHCACELQTVKVVPPPQPDPDANQLAPTAGPLKNPPEDPQKNASEAKPDMPPAEKPAVKEEPVYQVFMPPLVYDANVKIQPEPDPKLLALVRRVRVRPTLIFQGRVEEEVAAAASAPAPPPVPAASAAVSNAPKPAAPANDSFVDRVRNFVRKLWSRGS